MLSRLQLPRHTEAGAHAARRPEHPAEQGERKLQFFPRILARRQCRAHEGARASLREQELGEHRLVELNEVGARAFEPFDLATEDRRELCPERFLVRIGGAARLRHPHRAREQVRTGQRHLDRPIGERTQVTKVVFGQRLA